MKSLFRSVCLLVSTICLAPELSTLRAQSPTPSPSPSQSPKFTEQQMREMISKLQERIGKAADEVLGRIKKEENDLFIRFSYFRKPDRLNPATYASKEDVEQWSQSLQQLKQKADGVERLYANAELDLGNALIQQRINQSVAEQIKRELLQSFPWEVIRKKGQLMKEFISEFGDLLTFYNKNWGSWKPEPASSPAFNDPALASSFQALRDKINLVGGEIENQYKAMMGTPSG